MFSADMQKITYCNATLPVLRGLGLQQLFSPPLSEFLDPPLNIRAYFLCLTFHMFNRNVLYTAKFCILYLFQGEKITSPPCFGLFIVRINFHVMRGQNFPDKCSPQHVHISYRRTFAVYVPYMMNSNVMLYY